MKETERLRKNIKLAEKIIKKVVEAVKALKGNMSDDICNLTQKVVTTKANQNVKLINNTKFVKSMTINGNYVFTFI